MGDVAPLFPGQRIAEGGFGIVRLLKILQNQRVTGGGSGFEGTGYGRLLVDLQVDLRFIVRQRGDAVFFGIFRVLEVQDLFQKPDCTI